MKKTRGQFVMRQRLLLGVTAACCLVCSPWLPTLSASIVYDLNADWSDAVNPNGPWSYREGTNVLGHVNDWQGLSGDFTGVQPAWARAEVGITNLPAWMKVASGTGVMLTVDWQLGDIITHSTDGSNGVGSGSSNVIWTSPLTGTIDVSGAVWMGRDIGRGNHWELSLNGSSLTSGNISSGDMYNRSSPFAFSAGSGGPTVLNQISVVPGDVLKLEITKTSGFGDYAGVNLTVTATAVPEARTLVVWSVFATLMAAAGKWRRLRAQWNGCIAQPLA